LEITWKDCSLRNWLNQVFYTEAFSENEQEQIIESTVSNPDSTIFDTEGGGDTEDKVFLLSSSEAEKYLDSKKERMAAATESVKNGEPEVFVSEFTDMSFWWLRSPGSEQSLVQTVGAEGAIAESGFLVNRTDIAVRPAIWVRVS